MTITIRAAAKINLHLAVGAARADGFHPLQTVYQAISLYDDLDLDHVTTGEVTLTCAGADHVALAELPAGPDNLAVRAVESIRAAHGGGGTSMRLHKNIPIAGGMAGGSADAAAALLGFDRLHGLDLSDEELLRLAAELGSDIPFALIGGTALGTGRGEIVEPLTDPGAWAWVVVPPATGGLSTPQVYRHFDRLHPDAPADPAAPDDLIAALGTGDPAELARHLRNDLQDAAVDLRPELGVLLRTGEEAGALRGLVSGSGPSCVFLCADADAARAVAAELGARYDLALVAHGPVAGAHRVTAPQDV